MHARLSYTWPDNHTSLPMWIYDRQLRNSIYSCDKYVRKVAVLLKYMVTALSACRWYPIGYSLQPLSSKLKFFLFVIIAEPIEWYIISVKRKTYYEKNIKDIAIMHTL